MLNLKQNNAQINPIIILLIITIILGVILALKITGVIKPAEEDFYIDTTQKDSYYTADYDNRVKALEKESKKIQRNLSIINIVVFIIVIVLNIGICKLYEKLSIPKYIITFNFIWPILSLLLNSFQNELTVIVSLICSILGIVSFGYYFKAVGMSAFWAILPFFSVILYTVGIIEVFTGNGGMMLMIGFVAMLAFIIAYILSNIKLARIFNKGIGFTIGLVILAPIFQSILGYEKN